MEFRQKFLPRSLSDAAVTTFLVIMIPVVYWYELFIVMPSFYHPWTFWYMFHFILGTFILFNVTSNYAAIIFRDTSIKGHILPSAIGPNWRFCSVCECAAPPRSWHCKVCNTCILKRDHHCMFTSCCIGHYNLRYFMVFILYMFIATMYATYYNLCFVWSCVELRTWFSLVKIVFPLAMLFVEWSASQMFLFLTLIIAIGCGFTGILLYFHVSLMLKGMVTHEKNKNIRDYDLGRNNNILNVLGENWRLVWISPFIESKLLSDGINWDKIETNKGK